MKHLTLVILLALAPLSWGEEVYYCVLDHYVGLEPTESDDAYQLLRYETHKFTFKYEADAYRLAFKGIWGGDGAELDYLNCQSCIASVGIFHAADKDFLFRVSKGRFTFAATSIASLLAKAGTCTKF
jgi:hypothetical protein